MSAISIFLEIPILRMQVGQGGAEREQQHFEHFKSDAAETDNRTFSSSF